jgi:hypothetical protein
MKNKDTARILIVDDQIHALQGVSRIMRWRDTRYWRQVTAQIV